MKISWMKLDTNILDNGKIKLLRKYPQGDSLFVLWIAILCKAMKSEVPGVLLISEGSPYTPEDLASITELDLKVVQMGLELFNRFGMISMNKYNAISVSNMNSYQSFDAIERKRELTHERVKRHRTLKKQGLLEASVTRYTVTSNAKVTPQIRLDEIREDKREEPTEEKHIYAHELQLYIRMKMIACKMINDIDMKEYTNISDIIDNLDTLNKERIDDFFRTRKSIKKNFVNNDLKEFAADQRRLGKTLQTFSPQPTYTGFVPEIKEDDSMDFINEVSEKIKRQQGAQA
jgi:predicted phage replisome organizer